MSMKMLRALNGRNNGPFKEWLDNYVNTTNIYNNDDPNNIPHRSMPRIGWYPGAGVDMFDILHPMKEFIDLNLDSSEKRRPRINLPDIIIHTDCLDYAKAGIIDNLGIDITIEQPVGHSNKVGKLTILDVEELPRLNLPYDDQGIHSSERLYHFDVNPDIINRVFFLWCRVDTEKHGSFYKAIIYAFCENAAFCAKMIIPNKGKIEHIYNLCTWGSMTGSNCSINWLFNSLKKIGCKLFISHQRDRNSSPGMADQKLYVLFPNLATPAQGMVLEKIGEDNSLWGHTWFKIK